MKWPRRGVKRGETRLNELHAVGRSAANSATRALDAAEHGRGDPRRFTTLFHNWSNAYYQYRNGTLEQEQWAPHLREAERNAGYLVVRAVWADRSLVYDDSFRQLLDGSIAEAKTRE